jgi:hypothetical protein
MEFGFVKTSEMSGKLPSANYHKVDWSIENSTQFIILIPFLNQ